MPDQTERRFAVSASATQRLAGRVVIDVDDFPDADMGSLILGMWATGDLTGPAFPDLYVTTDYELLLSVELADGTTVHSGAHDFLALTGVPTDERTWVTVLEAVKALVTCLNHALDEYDTYVGARLDELTFLQMAVGFDNPSMIDEVAYSLAPSPITLEATVLVTVLEAVDDLLLDDPEEGRVAVAIADRHPTVGDVTQIVEDLDGDEPDDEQLQVLHAFATNAGIADTLLSDFDAQADTSPSLAVETIGFLLTTAAELGLTSRVPLRLLFDRAGDGRAFRVAGTVTSGRCTANVMTGAVPTTVLTGPSAPTTPWRLLHGVETALAALNGAFEKHCDSLMDAFVDMSLDDAA